MRIHPTAIIHPSAQLADDVEVGPYSVIAKDVHIDSGTKIESHVVIKGTTHIGKRNHVYQFCSVGEDCQDLKYKGEPTRLEIGNDNVIREGCTLHRGTVNDQGLTRIGNHNLLMANVHIAHDCDLKDNIVIANNAALAGHVSIDHFTILGGFVAVHQFCCIGAHAMLGVGSVVLKDVPAYLVVSGNTAVPRGINQIGLKRRGFTTDVIKYIRWAYKVLYLKGHSLDKAIDIIRAKQDQCPELGLLLSSLHSTNRGVIR